jgi:guanylate kinase
MILIFSAPSGSGKSTLVHYLLSQRSDLEFSVSCTTRPPRGKEQDGVDYYFISHEEFEQRIRDNAFIEYESVYSGTYYGTLKSEIQRIEQNGHHAVFDIDVMGGMNLKRIFG